MPTTTAVPYSKQEFIYECCLRGLQGSLANPNQQASIASLVRDAERLWDELQEWERQNAADKRDKIKGSVTTEKYFHLSFCDRPFITCPTFRPRAL